MYFIELVAFGTQGRAVQCVGGRESDIRAHSAAHYLLIQIKRRPSAKIFRIPAMAVSRRKGTRKTCLVQAEHEYT
jgi:hypothetical protein